MKLYNTLTKQLEEFKPQQDNQVKFYHCGPTVYWTQHIGNLRGMTMGDLIRRSLMYVDYDVNYVRNYTDVGHLTGDNIGDADSGEDRMEKGAKREGLTPEQIADKYIEIFEEDIKEINLLEPTHKSKATAKVTEIIEMIQMLLQKQAAYITPKAVYFDITKAKDYPAFSAKKLEDQRTGAGKGDVSDSNKKNPADFALWFFKTGVHKNALQYWSSPFKSEEVENGEGFPGWHIECSVIAKSFLGDTLDIHMGGVEHISIHHPNEIAQSETANETVFANYWLHNEHLLVDNKKMSKSEGTGFSLKEIKDKGFDPMDLRYFFLNAHYKSKQNFTWEALNQARISREKLVERLEILLKDKNFNRTKGIVNKNPDLILKVWKDKFKQALDEDINIPKALAILWDLLKSKESNVSIVATIIDFDKVLGLQLESELLIVDIYEKSKNTEIKNLLKEREQLRLNGQYTEADNLRKKIEDDFNISIKDTPQGPEYKIKK